MNEDKLSKVGESNVNFQGCPMKISEYNKRDDIIVEFQDKYRAKVHTEYGHFKRGQVKNPYYPSVFDVGFIGTKYPCYKKINGKSTQLKEYNTWTGVLERCYDAKYKIKHPTYKDVTCCEEWLNYENFYEWLHSQDNFDKWLNGKLWAIDKDILVKGNKVYSPDTCCLVPQVVNTLFVTNSKNKKSNLPIGVRKHINKFRVTCNTLYDNKNKHVGMYETSDDAFYFGYKPFKENIIKQVAKEEYDNGNITERCYKAMMNYEVEITD